MDRLYTLLNQEVIKSELKQVGTLNLQNVNYLNVAAREIERIATDRSSYHVLNFGELEEGLRQTTTVDEVRRQAGLLEQRLSAKASELNKKLSDMRSEMRARITEKVKR